MLPLPLDLELPLAFELLGFELLPFEELDFLLELLTFLMLILSSSYLDTNRPESTDDEALQGVLESKLEVEHSFP